MLGRIERHDVLNAMALALILLLCGYLVLRWVGYLGDVWDGGLWQSSKPETLSDEELAELAAEVAIGGTRPPNEVSVIVGNGSDGREGMAGRATERLASVGYGVLPATNKDGQPVDVSTIYFGIGFQPDALQVGALLGIPDSRIRPLSITDPGVPTDGADVIVVLGNDANL